jgi:hypothetical protein
MKNVNLSSLLKKSGPLFVYTFLLCSSNVFSQTTRYVDASRADNSGLGTSWATAKRDLQVAINGATAGDQIWVKAGTYLPTHDPFGNTSPANNRDKALTLKEGVKIYGGFAGNETLLSQRNWKLNVTTLSGDLGILNTLTDNAYHVVLSVNLTNATVFDGFTITKGYATAPWLSRITVGTRIIDRYKGAGIYNLYSSTQFANLKITQNSADCTDQNDDSWGAGMVSENANSTIIDCIFDTNTFLINGNSFGVFGAGLIISGGSGHTLTRCVFVNNTSGSGIIAGSQGGGLYLNGNGNTITNCIFYGNGAQNGAAVGFGGGEFNTSNFVNCTFANNTSSFAGTSFTGFADATFRNCIFWNNNPTSSSVAGRNEIFSQETRPQFWPTFNNCIIRDATGSPLSVTNTVTSNVLNGNPLFVNYNDGDGPDNIWGTADDGLRLQCSSTATGTGTGSTPVTDILGLPRTAVIDMGAYEGGHENGIGITNALSTSQTTVQLAITNSGLNNFSNCTNLVASLRSGTPYTVAGTVTTKVWIQSIQPANYVKRHYEMTPENNATTATGKVTLYFSQQDFNDFNAVSAIDLPTGPSDISGKANLVIEKRAGISSDGSGLPLTYSGAVTTIDPLDTDIIWNAPAQRWEVSFEVSGFSGFFIKSVSATLPLTLVDFTAKRLNDCNRLEWVTNDELNTDFFMVEGSRDGALFTNKGVVQAVGSGNNSYRFSDCSMPQSMRYYRLKMVDKNGETRYSKIVSLPAIKEGKAISLYPSLVQSQLTIVVDDPLLHNSWVSVFDMNGRMYKRIQLKGQYTVLDTEDLKAGMYIIRLQDVNNSLTFVKQ